jgi:hypothetical protein
LQPEEKVCLVRETYVPETSVSLVARGTTCSAFVRVRKRLSRLSAGSADGD